VIKDQELLLLQQMVDKGDASMAPWSGGDLANHTIETITGAKYLVWLEEVGDDGCSGGERASGSHHCNMDIGSVEVDEIKLKITSTEIRSIALLREAIDWIGVVNLSEQEEVLALDLQRRIARLLAELRI